MIDPILNSQLGFEHNIGDERSSCPNCDDPDCTFPPECQDAVGVMPERGYPHHDHDE